MESGDHSDTLNLVSGSAADSKLKQHAELGITENLPAEQPHFTGVQHISHQPEELLFGGGVRKDKILPSVADINQFILHESRANVPTEKGLPASTNPGQSSKESKNEDSRAIEKPKEFISAVGNGDKPSTGATGANAQKATLRPNEVPTNGQTEEEDSAEGKRDNTGNVSTVQNITYEDRRGEPLGHDNETRDLGESNSQTDTDLIKESTEIDKTDNEGARTLIENVKISEENLSNGQNDVERQKEAVGSVVKSETENVKVSDNQSDSFVSSKRLEFLTRPESDRISEAERHKEFISHEGDESDERKQQELEDKEAAFINSEKVISVPEEKEKHTLETAEEKESEEKQDDSKLSISHEQEDKSGGSDQKTEIPVSKDDTQDEWLDILGSGQLKKKVIKKAENDYRPQNLHICEINLEGCLEDGTVVEKFEKLKIQIGDVEIIQGIDLALPLMNVGEIALLEVGSRFAYGSLGRSPDIPPDATLVYTIELLSAENEPHLETLSIAERKEIGHKKRERGNWWFSRQEYSFAIQSYRRAIEFLDEAEGGFSIEKKEVSEDAEKQLQELLEDRLKVFNNLAAAQMKIKAYDAALTSVENVLRCQPQNVKALFRKGKILAAKGDTAGALTILRNASQLEPESKVIKQEVQRLMDVIKHDTKQEKSLYKKMLGQSKSTERSSSKGSKISYRTWGVVCSSIAVVLLGAVAYRYKFL